MDEGFCEYLLQAPQKKKSSENVRNEGDQFDPFINLIAPKGEKPKCRNGFAKEFEKINIVDTESVIERQSNSPGGAAENTNNNVDEIISIFNDAMPHLEKAGVLSNLCKFLMLVSVGGFHWTTFHYFCFWKP